MDECGRWLPFIELYASLIHPKYAHYVTLPAEGGMLDQPAETMGIMAIIKAEYIDYLREVNQV